MTYFRFPPSLPLSYLTEVNFMTKEINRFEMTALELIQLKKLHLDDLRSKYYDVITKERQIKNGENNVLLKTDFKSLGLTNEKQRTAYVQESSSKDRFELDQLKYEYKQQEDIIEILNDLIKLRIAEIGGEK